MRNLRTLAFFALLAALARLAEGAPEAAQSTRYSLLNELDGAADSVLQFGRLANDGFPDSDQLPEGHVCMDKVVEVEETIYDEEMRCSHVTTQSCHQKYETVFKPAQYKKCRDTFKKSCYYEYKKIPQQHNVEICNDNLRRDCDKTDGAEICTTEYVTVCETETSNTEVSDDVPNCEIEQVEACKENAAGETVCRTVPRQKCELMQQVNAKLSRSTECKSVPREVCGPEACPVVRGDRICRNEVKTVVQEVPEESCQMAPRKDCSMETQIIPSLEAKEECVDVPKEICNMVQVNPRTVRTPTVKKWCGPAALVGSGGDDEDDAEGSDGEGEDVEGSPPPAIRRTQAKPSRKQGLKTKIDPAVLATLKRDFPGLAEAIGGLFFQGKSRVGNGRRAADRLDSMKMAKARGKSRMTRF